MASKKDEKEKSKNKVGRPKKKYGTETLMNNKKSFKVYNTNVVVDKHIDPLLLIAAGLLAICTVLYIFVKIYN